MLDIIIRGGLVPDFENGTMKPLDIGIKDGKIISIGDVDVDAKEIVNAEGLVVSPGFIDIHMHEEDFLSEGERYTVANYMLKMGVTTALGGNCGDQYQSTHIFRDIIENIGGSPINYMLLAGYNAARVGFGIGHTEPTPPEVEKKLINILKKELSDGAFGISFGVEYDPGITYEEICRVIKAMGKDNLFVSMHYRADSAASPDSIKEMIDIANETGVRFQISHLSSCSAMGQMKDTLWCIHEAMDENSRLSYDTYPYDAFCTNIGSEVFSEGCFDNWRKSYSDVVLLDEPFKNMHCSKEIFEDARKNYSEMLAIAFVMQEDDIAMAVADNYGMIASDGTLLNGGGHPRTAGTFPRVLGKYVREEKKLSLIHALRKMTIIPARRLGLKTKGQIREGCDADICIFNPEEIQDKATYTELLPPVGIEMVIINGQVAMRNNVVVNDRLGRFIF